MRVNFLVGFESFLLV